MRVPTIVLASLLALAGCGVEVQRGLDERQAGEVLSALRRAGIAAEREASEGQGFRITVARDDAERAAATLAAASLPRPKAAAEGADEGVFASPAAVRARRQVRLAGEIERTIEGIPGVASARGHLASPVDDPLRGDATHGRVTASVLILRSGTLVVGEEEIRRLVAHAVEGLQAADVAVVLASAPPPVPPEAAGKRPSASSLLVAALVALLVLSVVCAFAVLRLRALRRRLDEQEAGGR